MGIDLDLVRMRGVAARGRHMAGGQRESRGFHINRQAITAKSAVNATDSLSLERDERFEISRSISPAVSGCRV